MADTGQTPWQALAEDFGDFTDLGRLTHLAVRLAAAALLGGVLGYQREKVGKAAGLRTHMLVAIGAMFFVLIPQLEGVPLRELTRVIQGVVTGIGFLGGGAILKLADSQQIKGLTTAASIWLTAAIGVAVGLGRIGFAALTCLFAFVILEALYQLDQRIAGSGRPHE